MQSRALDHSATTPLMGKPLTDFQEKSTLDVLEKIEKVEKIFLFLVDEVLTIHL
ncbi:MAG: hypothetical protein JJU05_03550 [Verrucomicrobia bacterium]|nr:hypothetical protein [Verrucomicrobiota bacterium]MCH8526518.1 hypothetical protein [Kiritimatiellia bacterium]